MKKLKLLGWIYFACSLVFIVIIALYTSFNKIPVPHTLIYGIGWSDCLLVALITRKDRPKDFVSTLMIALVFFVMFIITLVYDYIIPRFIGF